MAAVYWQGADGNIYYKGSNGVQNVGKALNTSDKGFDASGLSAVANRIDDPNPPAPTNVVAPGNSNGTSSAPATADKSNDIALQTSGLGAVDSQSKAGTAAIDAALGQLTGQYDAEAGTNEKSYTDNSNQNQNNLQKDKQTALVNAATGRQGLFGSLSSIGALSGDGITLANEAVQKGANADLSGASDTYGENQSGLDTAIGTFRQEDKERRDNAATAATNAKTNVANDAAKSRMAFLSNISNDYAAEGNAGQAKTYSDQAAALYPTLAATSVPDSNIAYTGAAFTPATLSSYMSGGTQVSSTPAQSGQNIPGLVATGSTKKKQLATV